MARFQERFCYGIKRESSFAGIPREKTERIPITLQREKTLNPERSVYTIHRDQSVRGERISLSFPRERAFETTKQKKPVKFQKLCGWNTPDIGEGVAEWMKIQLLIQGKKDRKLRISSEDLVYRHVPKRRCPGLSDTETFENYSLHPNFFPPKEEEREEKTKKKRKQSTDKSVVKANGTKRNEDDSDIDHKRRLLRSRSKDDMSVISPRKLDEELDKYSPQKRCRSVTIGNDNAWSNPGSSSQLKRLLKCAKLYHSNDYTIFDEDEDEGYGSKTSSADDKLTRRLRGKDNGFGEWDVPLLDIDSDLVYKTSTSVGKPAGRFSYTHQNASKPPVCGDSDDEGIKDLETGRTDSSIGGIKYYNTGYQDNSQNYITKLLERTYSQMGHHKDISDMVKIRELRSTKLTIGRISIQDATDTNSSSSDQQTSSPNSNTEFYDQRKTLVRSNSSLQTDRTQYQMYCTSPELKFNTNNQRPVSKKVTRSIREEHSQRLAQTELINKTRFPYLDFYRAHSSVNLPLSDLLPAVDRSLKTRQGKKKQYIYENVPTAAPIRESQSILDREATKISTEANPVTLGGPAFKPEPNRLPEGTLKRQPTFMMEYYQNPAQWLRNQTSKLSEGSSPGVRLSGNPDKDSKKKLREAFSKFYHTRSSMKNRDWARDYKYMWNT